MVTHATFLLFICKSVAGQFVEKNYKISSKGAEDERGGNERTRPGTIPFGLSGAFYFIWLLIILFYNRFVNIYF